jgi:CHAT domain-containing protein
MVIVPDGPLHLLPFAALHDPLSRRRYVVEAKPFIVASSATLYDTLTRSAPRGAAPTAVVGFGDPVYPSAGDRDAGSASATVARAFDRGLSLTPLPATRRELAALRSLSPQARLWLGAEATEERAKALGRDARIVHFACHGYLDEQFPLESGLALSMSAGPDAGENGLLQAWEVFESVRFDADLVTLSACQTGLGQDMGGEGLLGLTWAFQYAGARSVLATLWEVNDASTAELMRAFYRNVAAGVPAPEALRRAQVALLRNASTAPPYFWASFTLAGAGR